MIKTKANYDCIRRKKGKVIHNIQNIKDEILLDYITEITDINPIINEDFYDLTSENINPIIIQLIEKAEKQIENGDYYSHSEVKGIVNSWK